MQLALRLRHVRICSGPQAFPVELVSFREAGGVRTRKRRQLRSRFPSGSRRAPRATREGIRAAPNRERLLAADFGADDLHLCFLPQQLEELACIHFCLPVDLGRGRERAVGTKGAQLLSQLSICRIGRERERERGDIRLD